MKKLVLVSVCAMIFGVNNTNAMDKKINFKVYVDTPYRSPFNSDIKKTLFSDSTPIQTPTKKLIYDESNPCTPIKQEEDSIVTFPSESPIEQLSTSFNSTLTFPQDSICNTSSKEECIIESPNISMELAKSELEELADMVNGSIQEVVKSTNQFTLDTIKPVISPTKNKISMHFVLKPTQGCSESYDVKFSIQNSVVENIKAKKNEVFRKYHDLNIKGIRCTDISESSKEYKLINQIFENVSEKLK